VKNLSGKKLEKKKGGWVIQLHKVQEKNAEKLMFLVTKN